MFVVRESAVISAAPGTPTLDVSDLENVVIQAVQVNDAGTVVIDVESSIDGTVFIAEGAQIIETGFAAGANKAVERSISDSNGMSKPRKVVRLNISALAGGGTYKLLAAGFQTRVRG